MAIYFHEAAYKRRVQRGGPNPQSEDGYPLTPRETECLIWTAKGKTAGDIADILNISEHTVRFHIARAMKKLNVYSKTHAAAKSLQLGLITI